MSIKRILGTMLMSRMAGRGGSRGLLGNAAMLGMLGGSRRGGFGGKAGLAALGYMAYRAYKDREERTAGTGPGSANVAGSGGGFGGVLGDLANHFGVGNAQDRGTGAGQRAPDDQDEQAAAAYSDEKALLLIRAMIAAARSDGSISADERARIMKHLDETGADAEDKRLVEREIENPKPLDDLLAQVKDQGTAQEFYLASRAAMDGQSESDKAYLRDLRQRLKLSEEDASQIDELAS